MSDDGQILFVSKKKSLKIYSKNPTYILTQTLLFNNVISEFSFSSTNKILAVGTRDNIVKIFHQNGTSFDFLQTINIGFTILGVDLINSLLEVHGLSSNILLFQDNGT